jgi:PAS domain S-box-containing protein
MLEIGKRTGEVMEHLCLTVVQNVQFGAILLEGEGKVLAMDEGARKALSPEEKGKERTVSLKDLAMVTAVAGQGKSGFEPITLTDGRRIMVQAFPFDDRGKSQRTVFLLFGVDEFEGSETGETDSFKRVLGDFAAILENTYDGLYITDGKANTVAVNKAYERITGIKREELLGKNMKDLVSSGVIDRSVSIEVLQKKRPITIMQELRSGKKMLVTGTPVFDKKKARILLVVTNVRDITELIELKSKLHERTLEASRYLAELDKLKTFNEGRSRLVTNNAKMLQVLETAIRVAQYDSNIFITGESGAGKGLLARLIHEASGRKEQPFIKINCAGIPEELFESELFGYEPGAFSGASTKGKRGLLELATGGTLFLDEIGDMSLKLQSKLLHVIEEKEMTRLGSTKTVKLDVRIIAATNQDVASLISGRRFRQDLYFRLNTIAVAIPPLRERPEDILALVNHFIQLLNERYGSRKSFTPKAMQILTSHSYPGNVRELSNIVEQAFLVSKEELMGLDALPLALPGLPETATMEMDENRSFDEMMEMMEYRLIKRAMEKYGSTHKAARNLKISQSTVVRKMKKLNIRSSTDEYVP